MPRPLSAYRQEKQRARSREKSRRLWLSVQLRRVPQPGGGITPLRDVLDELVDRLEQGTTTLPHGWDVWITWRNREDGDQRLGPWGPELRACRRGKSGSRGFEKALLAWLRRKRSEMR